MAASRLDSVFQQLRQIVLMQDGGGLSDGQLLDLFISQKDNAAFEALVRRHGSMVMKVCYRVIGNHHDAEDAYQVIFLLLARKAASVKSREMVANWLHGVAYRTSLKARSLRIKAQVRERQVSRMPDAVQQSACHDLQPLIDQELSRLADIYRLPILLCDLEGKSIKKVAQQLGWPQGTVAGRLARGRKLLAKRLARHGLAMASGAVLLQNSASACVSPSLVAATVKAASAYAAGKSVATGMISANVAILIQGGLTAMFWTKLKIATAVLVVGSVFALGGSVLLNGTAGGQQIEVGKGVGEKPAIRQVVKAREKLDNQKKDTIPTKTEHEKLRGTWRVVELNYQGKKRSLQEGFLPQDIQWSFGKNRIAMNYTLDVGGYPQKSVPGFDARQDSTFRFWGDNEDAAPAQNTINMSMSFVGLMPTQGKEGRQGEFVPFIDQPVPMRGIFAWDNDKLKLCLRPTQFGRRPAEIPESPSQNENLLIVVLERDPNVAKSDEGKMQGDWRVVRREEDGQQINVPEPVFTFLGHLMNSDSEYGPVTTFELHAQKSPKQLISRPVNKVGIYSVDGDDLEICFGRNPKDVPDDFTAPNGSGRLMITLKRVKSAGEGATSSKGRDQEDAKTDEPAQNHAANQKPTTPETPKTDLDRMQGVWEVVSWEEGGKASKFEETVFMVDGKRACFQTLAGELKGGLYLDSTSNLRKFDLATHRDTWEGIYLLEGDTLRLCYERDDEPKRPSDFTTEPGSRRGLIVLKRIIGGHVFPYRRPDGSRTFPEVIRETK